MIYTDDNIHTAIEKVASRKKAMNWAGGKARTAKEWIANVLRKQKKPPESKQLVNKDTLVHAPDKGAKKSKKGLSTPMALAGAAGLGAGALGVGGAAYLHNKKSSVNIHDALEKIANPNRFKMYLRMVKNPQRAAKMAYPGKSSSWIKKFLKRLGY